MLTHGRTQNIHWMIPFLVLVSLVGGKFGIIAFYLLSLVYILLEKIPAATTVLLLTSYRTIINTQLFTLINSMQSLKWVFLFSVSLYLLLLCSFPKQGRENQRKEQSAFLGILAFVLYNALASFFCSSLPVISWFKLLSYSVIFCAVLKGMALTSNQVDWGLRLEAMLAAIVVISLFMFWIPQAYYGPFFEGFANQPNMLGIVLVLLVALLLVNMVRFPQEGFGHKILMLVCFALVYKCGSRTAFASCLLLVLTHVALCPGKRREKWIKALLIAAILVVVLCFSEGLMHNLTAFVYKYDSGGPMDGGMDAILYSRESQIQELLDNIAYSPWFGNGFGTPRLPFVSYSPNYKFYLEPGNIILAVLSYSGIFGMVVFLAMIGNIIRLNWQRHSNLLLLPLATILSSCGEMAFFSSNSVAILFYGLWGIYLFTKIPASVGTSAKVPLPDPDCFPSQIPS